MKKYLVIGLTLLLISGLAFAGGKQQPAAEAAGNVVTVFGAFIAQEEARFNAAMEAFEVASGIDVEYQSSKEFETLIFVQVEGGNPPDVAALPQPGLMKTFADRGVLVPLWQEIKEIIGENYAPVWLDLGSYQGTPYGVFHRVNVKSLVWYPKKAWEDRLNPSGPMVELAEALQKAEPNPGHTALVELEELGLLKSLITQNIDNLHQKAGSSQVIEVHGHLRQATCVRCYNQVQQIHS